MQLMTRDDIVGDLRALGVREGMVLLVHVSMSRIGPVVGGEQTMAEALLEAVGETGTLVMPSQSWQLCDPAYLADPSVSSAQWPTIRGNLPAYDPAVTPTRTMGRTAELFRTMPEVLRSSHPHRSFAARGPLAERVLAVHDLDDPVGERSPLSAIEACNGWSLLIGVGYEKCTMLHLAEHRSGTLRRVVRNGAPLLVDGRRRWVAFDEHIVHDEDFPDVGRAFAQETGLERLGHVGSAVSRLVPDSELVRFASAWFRRHRMPSAGAYQ
ncbi:MAG: AAC(3) family N-acetyltransferase [Bifidobacterium minimum]|jgi:aminoglycoside 3-N-acetyltransferase|nr:AAC(3) family N-acetyltransferase [Bifidobacterium minimum]